tara:strand:- start:1255 stop:2523 length:1269 start_codon:yes stop_codon:yes gene_type:complete
MLLIYRYLINFFFPIIIIVIFFRKYLNKEDKIRFKEKLFSSAYNINKNHNKKLIWIHAASLGELKSAIPLIKKLNKEKKFDFLITTTTLSASNLFSEELLSEKNITHRFFPIDKPSLVKEFLKKWSPNLIIFVESEVWPNFILEIKKNNIPLVLLNGRITKKTFLRWNVMPKLAEKIFQSFDLCLPSSKESKKYLEKLKVKNIKYLGNIKLAAENNIIALNNENKEILRVNKFWCALSTHKEEEIFCLKTHLNIKKVYKDIITIIIPRHIDRAEKIKSSCEKFNLNCQILSNGELIKKGKEIIIINSYGVTSTYLDLCKSVFIGKSMIKRLKLVGGQNPIEAAKLKCKIYHGPYVYNFEEIYELFNKYKISEKVYDEEELSMKITMDLSQSNEINSKEIGTINSLGKKILEDISNELDQIIN